jgi:hypothetical protein
MWKISASEVSSLIKKKPFKGCYEEAIINVFSKNPVTASLLESIKRKHGLISLSEVKETVLSPKIYEYKKEAARAIDEADRASDIRNDAIITKKKLDEAVELLKTTADVEIQSKVVQTFKNELAVKVKEVEKVAHVPTVAAIIQQHSERVSKEIESQPISKEVKELITKDAESELIKDRGTRGENAILDKYEHDTGNKVEHRNTEWIDIFGGSYHIVGRTDGYDEDNNIIIEVKNRFSERVWKKGTPDYDIIQLRVYMRGMNCDGEIVEHYKETGETRRTLYKNDDKEWRKIESALNIAVDDMNKLMKNPDKLADILKI